MKSTTKQSFLFNLGSRLVLPTLADFELDPKSTRSVDEQKQEHFCRLALFSTDLESLDWDWLPLHPTSGQATIEAALLALSCMLSGHRPIQSVALWLQQVAAAPIIQTTAVPIDQLKPNNWSWSRLFLRAYCNVYYGTAFSYREDLRNISHMYASDGMYLDGQIFDYYCGWDMQFWPHFFSNLVPEYSLKFALLAEVFLPRYAALFDQSTGANFRFGRSQHYGYTAACPFVAYYFNPVCRSDAVLSYLPLVEANVAFHQNKVQDPVDSYASNSSWLICGKTHLARFLPDCSPFWSTVNKEWPQQSTLDKFVLAPSSVCPSQFVADGQLTDASNPNQLLDARYLTCNLNSTTRPT